MLNFDIKKSEIDTEVFRKFVLNAAKGKLEVSNLIGKAILEHSENEEIKQNVKKTLRQLLTVKFRHLADSDQEGGVDFIDDGLIKLYTHGIQKKIDIRSDIPAFSELAAESRKDEQCMLGWDRLYTLYQSVTNAAALDGDILELGVCHGGGIKFIRRTLDALGMEKNVIGFDTFTGHPTVTKEDPAPHRVGLFNVNGVTGVEDYVDDRRVRFVVGDVSRTILDYAQESPGVCFAHFDLDVYQPTADALPIVFDLLPIGGIILVDDYGSTTCSGVKVAADTFLEEYQAHSFHLMTGQMIIMRVA